MRTALVFLVFLSALVTPVDLRVAESTTQQTQKPAPLNLRLNISDSRYCVGDDEIDGLQLKLRFVFENRSTGPVILFKRSPTPTRVMIARNLGDASAQQYELDFTMTWYSERSSDDGSACYKEVAPGNCFVTIAAGSSYETDGEVRVLAVRGDSNDVPGAVKSGEHVLQLVIPTWDESAKLAQEVAGRWHSHGVLWYQPLTSEPLTFTIDKERTVVECN
jgi:hypothetical protein